MIPQGRPYTAVQSRCEGFGQTACQVLTSIAFVQTRNVLCGLDIQNPKRQGKLVGLEPRMSPGRLRAQEIACPHAPPVITVNTDFRGTLWECLIRINVILLRQNFGCGSLA